MTAAASARGRSNRNRGHQAERDVARWLRSNGYPEAERAVATGFRAPERSSADPGDVRGVPMVVSVKDCATERLSVWWAELAAMDPARQVPRLLVVKRRGHADPGVWWCWMRLDHLAALCHDTVDPAPWWADTPVRMDLAAAVRLLRQAGFGVPDRPVGESD